MKWWFFLLVVSCLGASPPPGSLLLPPPSGWRYADTSKLGKNVQVMIVGQGKGVYPPSINIGVEPYPLTANDYVKMVKEINKSFGTPARDLGTLATKGGDARLVDLEMDTEWGKTHLLHAIFVRDFTVYVVTASASKEEFTSFLPLFLKTIGEVEFSPSVFEMVHDKTKREKLHKKHQELMAAKEKSPFASDLFQEEVWSPFLAWLQGGFPEMDEMWREETTKIFARDLATNWE